MYFLPKTPPMQQNLSLKSFATSPSRPIMTPDPQKAHKFRINTMTADSKTMRECQTYQSSQKADFRAITTPSQVRHKATMSSTGTKRQEHTQRMNEINLENLKLLHVTEHLVGKLKEIESKTDVVILQKQLEDLVMQSEARQEILLLEISSRDKKLGKLNIMFSSVMSQNTRLESESKVHQAQFEENLKKIKQLEHDVKVLSQRSKKYMEVAQMQREDLESRMEMMKEAIQAAEKGKDKLQKFQMKADKELVEKSKEIEVWQDPNFEQDMQSLETVREKFKDKTFFKSPLTLVPPNAHETLKGSTMNVGTSNQESYFARHEIQLDKVRVCYPSFLCFVEHHKKTLEAEMKNTKKTGLTFFPTMRAILDAKWTEIQMREERSDTRFPEFTYGWLNNFCIDAKTRSMRILTTQELMLVDDILIRLVVDLSNPITNKSWECITFKELLYDCATADEIYFYLFSRNLLYRGPQMLSPCARFEAIHYVPLPYAEFVIEHVLKSQEQQTIQLVKRSIIEKAVKKIATKNLYMVDGGFVLRLLLEIYRQEIRNRYVLLRAAFASQINLGFKGFRRILQAYFPDTSDTEMAVLYREAYSYGLVCVAHDNILKTQCTKVGVNIDTFYTACSESGFFIRHLKIHSMIKHPNFDSQGKLLTDLGNVEYVHFMQAYDKIDRFHVVHYIEQLGVESLLKQYLYFHEQFAKHAFKAEKCKHLYRSKNFTQVVHDYCTLMTRIRYVQNAQQYLQGSKEHNQQALTYYLARTGEQERQRKGNAKQTVVVAMHNFHQELRATNSTYNMNGMVGSMLEMPTFLDGERTEIKLCTSIIQNRKLFLLRSQAARRIQRLVRTKLTKFYSFVSNLLSAKLRSSVRATLK